jgi:hypothetical protein
MSDEVPSGRPSNAELRVLIGGLTRAVDDMRNEFRGQLALLVRTDVYRAEQMARDQHIAALEARIAAGEAERARVATERAMDRRIVWGAILSSVLGWVVTWFSVHH